MYLNLVSHFKLQLKPPLTIPVQYYRFLSPSENLQLYEKLPEVPTVVLLDVHLEVYLKVVNSSDYTYSIPA